LLELCDFIQQLYAKNYKRSKKIRKENLILYFICKYVIRRRKKSIAQLQPPSIAKASSTTGARVLYW